METIKEKFFEIVDVIISAWENKFLKILITTLAFILLWWLLNVIVKKMKKKSFKRNESKRLAAGIAFTCSLWALRMGLIIAYASVVGIETTGLAAIIASIGVGIGLALQGSLSNLAGGIVIVITRPFEIGDYIESNGQEGTVEDVKLFYTHLVSVDNKEIMIPNGTLGNQTITNYSRRKTRRLDKVFSISYNDNVELAINLIKNLCENNDLVMKDKEIFVKETCLNESSVDITMKVWCKTDDYWNLNFIMIDNVHKAFNDNGITIPYKQIDIHTK